MVRMVGTAGHIWRQSDNGYQNLSSTNSMCRLLLTFAKINLVTTFDRILIEVTVGETLEVHQSNL